MSTEDKLAETISSGFPTGNCDEEAISPAFAAARVRAQFVVIDRDDLPEVAALGTGDVMAEGNGETYQTGATANPNWSWNYALNVLAVSEYLRTNPPVDEQAVKELANALAVALGRDHARDLAHRLVAEGWKREVTP